MVWKTEAIQILRTVIGDLDMPQLYTDNRLTTLLIIASVQVINETDFDNIYVVDITEQTIIPDPSDVTIVAIKDNLFICLISLKAAVLLINAEMKSFVQSGGINIKDGPSSIDTKGVFANYILLSKQYLSDYEYLKMNYKIMRSNANSQAILTATTVRNIYGNLNVLSY